MRAIEFFSGIGGLHYALASAFPGSSVVGAFDVNAVANATYEFNHSLRPRAVDLSRLDVAETSRALGHPSAWLLSPPCQPYSRRGKGLGGRDARAWSFPALIDGLRGVDAAKRPRLVLVENVVGFERSETRDEVCAALEAAGYVVRELCVSPEDLGVPYSRPRYFLVARKGSERTGAEGDGEGEEAQEGGADAGEEPSSRGTGRASRASREPLRRGIPHEGFFDGFLGRKRGEHGGSDKSGDGSDGKGGSSSGSPGALPPAAADSAPPPPAPSPPRRALSDYLEEPNGRAASEGASHPHPDADADALGTAESLDASVAPLRPPALFLTHEQLLKAGWTLDLVTPSSRRVNCIAKSYGHYIKGSGSVLVTRNHGRLPGILRAFPVPSTSSGAETEKSAANASPRAPSSSNPSADAPPRAPWPSSADLAAALLPLAPRFLSPREVANLHSFPPSFAFPDDVTVRQRYALLGNSLSVEVVAAVLRWAVPEEAGRK